MASVKPALKTTTSNSPPIASITDSSGNAVPISSLLPNGDPSLSPRKKSKSVSFHEDTKPPSEEHPTIAGNANVTSSGVPSAREEYAFLLLEYSMVLVPLASVHAVLDVLVYRQYQQPMTFGDLTRRALVAFGVLFVLHSTIHPTHSSIAVQMILMFVAIVLGTYLVHAAAVSDYFAVMKQAPPLGTLLVWLALELEYYWSIVAAVTVGFIAWCVRV
ncbi:hypothetical protein POJ06DRAFT_135677 [Lipomyces tetrasporus]|uniref:DUF7719 domain-containing protein n=1 Tax=Lipomyces tetrasporus TaxID=54092 RepID=A0AAD7QQ14_9ASCO|nr:uncharacterized protein POJ06DRAFT_135677 [Lipomyces tetrasporus]KAJ8099477.1 hypothetical protein POJ06DRAFT_135677 [Lipomyces tetrasporus]